MRTFSNEMQCYIFGWESAALLFIMSLRAAVFVSREKERRTLELLVLTRLGKVRILAGKAAAALVEQAPGLFVLALHMLFVLSVWLPHREELWLLPAALPLSVVLSVAMGLYFALAAKHVVTAVSLTAVTWFFGATVGPAAAILSLRLTGSRELDVTVPSFFISGGLVAAAIVLLYARRGGYGSWLPAVAYSMIAGAILFAVNAHFGDDPVDIWNVYRLLEMTWMLPSAKLPTFTRYSYDASLLLLTSCVQAGLLAWMIISGLLGFEAQVKRA